MDYYSQWRAAAISTLLAHKNWSWASSESRSAGRLKLPPGHTAAVHHALSSATSLLGNLLALPTWGRARHLFTQVGRADAGRFQRAASELEAQLLDQMNALSLLVEEFKVISNQMRD